MRVSFRTIVLAIVALFVLIFIVLFVARQRAVNVPMTFNGPNEMLEGATDTLTCTATTNQNLRTMSIFQGQGSGVLAPDSDPDPKVVVRTYTPTAAGKSRTASFSCSAVDVNGLAGSRSLDFITRDQQAPTWNGPFPSLPPAGADGNAPGKVGVTFDVTIDAKDNGAGGVRGTESGIHILSLVRTIGSITVTNGIWTDPIVVPPGSPDGNSGQLDNAQTFTAQCTSAGNAALGASAVDAVGNDIVHTLPIECYN